MLPRSPRRTLRRTLEAIVTQAFALIWVKRGPILSTPWRTSKSLELPPTTTFFFLTSRGGRPRGSSHKSNHRMTEAGWLNRGIEWQLGTTGILAALRRRAIEGGTIALWFR